VRKTPLSKVGLTAAQQLLRSLTRKRTSKVRGALAPPATAVVGSASAGPQAEKEAVQGLGQLHGEVTPPRTSSGAQPAAPLKLNSRCSRAAGKFLDLNLGSFLFFVFWSCVERLCCWCRTALLSGAKRKAPVTPHY
jgi:hypothetical protein